MGVKVKDSQSHHVGMKYYYVLIGEDDENSQSHYVGIEISDNMRSITFDSALNRTM